MTESNSGTTAFPPKHLGFLDGVRGLAALYVVFHHALMNLPPPLKPALIERVLRAVGSVGHYAVDVFIVLSGYCLMLPLLRAGASLDVLTFIKRRAVRILPAYYLAMLLSLLLIATVLGNPTGTHWDDCIPVTHADVLYHVLLIHDWLPETTAKINHVFWSVGVEWKIYFLFPLLLSARAKFGSARLTLLATACGYVAWFVCWQLDVLNPEPWGSSFYYVGLFAMGMFAAEHAESVRAAGAAIGRRWLGVAVLLTLVVVAVTVEKKLSWQIRSALLGSWTVSLLVSLRAGVAPSWLMRLLESRACVWLGQRGYSIYLIHAPVLQLVYLYVMRPVEQASYRAPLMVVASLTATLLTAPVFYLLAERPFHRQSRRLAEKPARAPQLA